MEAYVNEDYYKQILDVKEKEIYDLKKEIEALRAVIKETGDVLLKLNMLERIAKECECE